jgi:molybdate transport system substrate-binding protein
MKVLRAILLLLAMCATAAADEIAVAAASDLQFVMKEIAARYEKQTGTSVKLSFGSSGNFFAQIQNGAPFDVFLSADLDYPVKLEKSGHAVAGSTFVYGVGRIALWVPARSSLNLEKQGMQALVEPSIRKIAIANPEHAPYGRAAVAAMEHARVYDRLKNKIVLGENISQAAQFVQSGAADIGVIALSLVLSEPMKKAGRYWVVPEESYPRLEQGAVLLKRGGPAGRQFLDWLKRPASKETFKKYGIDVAS